MDQISSLDAAALASVLKPKLEPLPADHIDLSSGLPGRGDFGRQREPDDVHPTEPLRAASVLVPLVDHPDETTVLLTERSRHLPSHAGQVSFPGGRVDPTDATPVETALRETLEEVGIPGDFITPIGALDTYETGTGFCILPIVAILRPGFSVTPEPSEVDEAFEVPLSFLMNPKNHERHRTYWKGATREYYAMPYDGHYIWGATAGMIVNLYERLYEL